MLELYFYKNFKKEVIFNNFKDTLTQNQSSIKEIEADQRSSCGCGSEEIAGETKRLFRHHGRTNDFRHSEG